MPPRGALDSSANGHYAAKLMSAPFAAGDQRDGPRDAAYARG